MEGQRDRDKGERDKKGGQRNKDRRTEGQGSKDRGTQRVKDGRTERQGSRTKGQGWRDRMEDKGTRKEPKRKRKGERWVAAKEIGREENDRGGSR